MMDGQVREQMYIVKSECWKCNNDMNVAIIAKGGNDSRGPESFSNDETKLAEDNGVLIMEQHSFTMDEKYAANTCPHCSTFIGQFYLPHNHLFPALYGDYEYKVIEIV